MSAAAAAAVVAAGDETTRTHSVWGLLVSQQPATVENGLLPYLEHRQRPFATTTTSRPQDSHVPSTSIDYCQLHAALFSATAPSAQAAARFARYLPQVGAQTAEGNTPLLPPDTLLLPLWQDMTSIGRLISNDVPLTTNPCVSGVHCSLSPIATAVAAPTLKTEKASAEASTGASHEAVHHLVSQLVGDVPPASAPASAPSAAPTQAHKAVSARTVRLSDYSTNSCLVNGRKVGKGLAFEPLSSGDAVDLMNAGPRHTAEYNLRFVFYHLDDFLARVATEPVTVPVTALASQAKSTDHTTARDAVKAAERQARRRALLTRAQWNILAQVYRMYHHDVEDFYELEKENPLGVGGFGKVYRGALRPRLATDTSASSSSPSLLRGELARQLKDLAPTADLYLSPQSGQDDTTEETRKTTYVQLKAQEAPPSVLSIVSHHTSRHKRARSPVAVAEDGGGGRGGDGSSCGSSHRVDTSSSAAAPPPSQQQQQSSFVFAVKVVNKQRMLLQALGDDDDVNADGDGAASAEARARPRRHAETTASASAAVPMSDEDRAMLRCLVQLETQQEDYAAQRERDLLDDAIADILHPRPQLSSPDGGASHNNSNSNSNSNSNGSSSSSHEDRASFLFGSLSQLAPASLGGVRDESLPAEWFASPSPRTREAEARAKAARTQRRDELLAKLPPQLRKFYQKELQQKRRQQCEISILLAVNHPSVARLYEVFDRPVQLALVMEQATGGEVWDLLQAPKRKDANIAATAPPPPPPQDEGLSNGGPLPEFVVKMLMVQVLEAVHYLHSMGIVHRDLKLENLLLHRPCHVAGLCTLQLNVMRQKLHDARCQRQPHATAAGAACGGDDGGVGASERVAIANPFSLVHTVHVPRAMWPIVKVTDFGLSHVMGVAKGPQRRRHRGATAAAANNHTDDDADADHDDETALIYARNDMTTSCGTPIYAAPEVVNPQLRPDRVGYSAAVDMYSVGVIAFALLTGRAPFPSRQRGGGHGGAVVDYTAPLTFERYRKAARQVAPPPPQSPAAVVGVALPPLACVEEVNVSMDDLDVPEEKRWAADVEALARRITVAEQRQPRRQSTAATTTTTAAGAAFDSLLADTIKALDAYVQVRAEAAQEPDLDRFVWHSTQRHAQRSETELASSSSSSSANRAQFALPPISLMGQDFLRSLLLARPTERLTARQALDHPWLRDCV